MIKKIINLISYLNHLGLKKEANFISELLTKEAVSRQPSYNAPRAGKKRWSIKYKRKINCSNPKGFSQKQYCKRKSKGGDYK